MNFHAFLLSVLVVGLCYGGAFFRIAEQLKRVNEVLSGKFELTEKILLDRWFALFD